MFSVSRDADHPDSLWYTSLPKVCRFPTFSIDTYYNLSPKIEVCCMVKFVGLIIVHCMINGVILMCWFTTGKIATLDLILCCSWDRRQPMPIRFMDVVQPLKEILPRSPTPLSIYRYFFFVTLENMKVACLNDSDSRYFPAPPRWVRDRAGGVELLGSSIIMVTVVW